LDIPFIRDFFHFHQLSIVKFIFASLILIPRFFHQPLSQDVKELFIVERDVVFSAHASRENLTGKCVKRLSRMRGPGGSQCNMFVEAHPEPAPWIVISVWDPPP